MGPEHINYADKLTTEHNHQFSCLRTVLPKNLNVCLSKTLLNYTKLTVKNAEKKLDIWLNKNILFRMQTALEAKRDEGETTVSSNDEK